MKRWAVARMVDDGFGGRESAFNRYPCNTRVWTSPSGQWCVGQIATANLTPFESDADIFVLPDATLDSLFSSFNAGVRNNVRNKLSAAGFQTAAIQNNWTIRQILLYIVQQLEPSITSIESGDVVDKEV